jgi:hypothetical protein
LAGPIAAEASARGDDDSRLAPGEDENGDVGEAVAELVGAGPVEERSQNGAVIAMSATPTTATATVRQTRRSLAERKDREPDCCCTGLTLSTMSSLVVGSAPEPPRRSNSSGVYEDGRDGSFESFNPRFGQTLPTASSRSDEQRLPLSTIGGPKPADRRNSAGRLAAALVSGERLAAACRR